MTVAHYYKRWFTCNYQVIMLVFNITQKAIIEMPVNMDVIYRGIEYCKYLKPKCTIETLLKAFYYNKCLKYWYFI